MLSENINNFNDLDTNTKIQIYENDIELYLDQYCIVKDLDKKELYNISQSRWNSILIYIYNHVFKIKDADIKYNNKKSNLDYSNKELLLDICNYYIHMCFEYDKAISITGFSYLTGITRETIYSWNNGDSRSSSLHSDIFKILYAGSEESLSDKLVSYKGNPVGILGVLNKKHGWDTRKQETKIVLSIPDMPDMERKYITDDTPDIDF